MMDPETELGTALTGQAPVDPATASSQWDDYLQRPGNRQALLQMGLQLMQPQGIGQTMGGHIAQAIGAGGEAVDRREASDLKDTIATTKLAQADEKLRLAQQREDSVATRAGASAAKQGAKKIGGLTDLMRERFARQDTAAYERQLDRDAADLVKRSSDQLADPNSDIVKQYRGKTRAQVRDMLRAERPQGGATAGGSVDENSDGESDGLITPVTDAPPVAGARKAPDGNWYVPDTKNPGKYLLVK